MKNNTPQNVNVTNISADYPTSITCDLVVDVVDNIYWRASGLMGLLVRCSAAFGVTIAQVQSRERTEDVVFARQAYCYMAYRQTQQSMMKIGELIGRDHSTVTHSINTVKNYLKVNYRRFTDIYNLLLID